MDSAGNRLHEALSKFIEESVDACDRLRRDGTAAGVSPEVNPVAAVLAGLPSAREADAVALETAKANHYLLRDERKGMAGRSAGRPLTAGVLVDTGVAALLVGGVVNVPKLTTELAGYLAGPAVAIWDYVIVDADLTVTKPVPVVDGWELVTPTANELADLVGIPSAARYLPRPTFNLDQYGELAMLRRLNSKQRPRNGTMIHFDLRPAYTLWQPLLALSLYKNAVVNLWARFVVEPGRRVDMLYDHVYTEPWTTPDGEIEIDVPRRGDFHVDLDEDSRFRRFFQQLAPLLDAALAQPVKPNKASKERAARLRRIAEHFLAAGSEAIGEGEVLSEFNADAVLHYIVALEATLAGGDSDKSEQTRKVVQRAAVLAGIDDTDRLQAAETVRLAYAARSAYAHGSEPEEIDLPALRRVVRDCLLARLVLGDPTFVNLTLAKLADATLLHHTQLIDFVRLPINKFWAAVDQR